jgi:hypothetical protein
MPAMGSHVFPPGQYRFVLPYREVGRPSTERQVVLPFIVAGLDASESATLIDALRSRVCPWGQRAYLLDVVERTAAPEALPRLLDLPAVPGEPFDQRLAQIEVLARVPELTDSLVEIVERGPPSVAVPVAVALLRETTCSPTSRRCSVATARLAASLGEKDEPRPEAVDALARTWETWPPTVVGALVQLLGRTTSNDLRVAISDALATVGRSEVKKLGPNPREVVAALRRAALRTRDRTVRGRILEDAHDIAEAVGDEASRDQIGVGFEPPDLGVSMPPQECAELLARLAPLLRFAGSSGGRAELVVRYGVSSMEPYTAPLRE